MRRVVTKARGRAVPSLDADLRYDDRSRAWSFYAADRNERWFLYNDVASTRDVGPLLAEIGDDPTGIFWG
jgi:hypothetical protein